jgi:cell division protein FtsA
MATENIIAALDIGTTKIVCLVGEMDTDGRLYVIGHGQSQSEGLRRGVLVDMEKTMRSIRKAVDDAALVSGTEIDRVTVGIAGEHIRSINSHGVIAVNRADNEITMADVQKAVDAARTVSIPVDREIIHVIPQEYAVDDQTGIKDPIGMSGVRLEVEAHIVTASVTTARNIYRALERCALDADHIVLESLALSEALLTPEETRNGVVVVDIGGELTNISIFHDGAIRHTATVPLGGRNVTNDIAIGLRTTVEQAESLKLAHGAALASMVDAEEMIQVESAAGGGPKEISRNVLASIIEPRMEEILALVIRELRRAEVEDILASGMVITGGGSRLAGTIELAEQMLDMPVRLATIRGFDNIPDELNNACYATAHGLLVYGFHNEPEATSTTSGKVRGMLKRFERWISNQF